MALVRLSNLIEIRQWDQKTKEWVADLFFHNADPLSTVRYKNQTWRYLPFIYQGATRNRTGDNIEAGLVMASNRLSMDYAQQVVQRKRKVVVYTCLMNNGFSSVEALISKENWAGTSMSYDADGLEITLASRVDAISFSIPNQHLRKDIVGELPTTGNINSR